MEKVIRMNVRRPSKNPGYEIRIGSDNLSSTGSFARSALGKATARVGLISNEKIFGLFGDEVTRSLEKAGFAVSVWLMKDGERYKNLRSLEALLKFFSEDGFTRTDAVVALGGGVVGDLAGFAASIHLRGIAFLQIPTTLLSMIDSSVGGKTGINTGCGKNLVGSFHQPMGVLIDAEVLKTLPKREMTAGFCEAVKQGAISGKKLFNQTASILNTNAGFEEFLASQIAFKASIVAGDERESVAKSDSRSRKILNFGHTFAHALEKATDYRYLKHGEAVGHGIIFAAELSKKLGLLDNNTVELLNDVVHRTGNLPTITHIDPKEVFTALRHDKKNIGGSLQWVLLKGIGKPVIVPHENITEKLVSKTIAEILSK